MNTTPSPPPRSRSPRIADLVSLGLMNAGIRKISDGIFGFLVLLIYARLSAPGLTQQITSVPCGVEDGIPRVEPWHTIHEDFLMVLVGVLPLGLTVQRFLRLEQAECMSGE